MSSSPVLASTWGLYTDDEKMILGQVSTSLYLGGRWSWNLKMPLV